MDVKKMNTKKSNRFTPNNTNEWKTRGFKTSNSTTATVGESCAFENQEQKRFQNSFSFKADTRGTNSSFNAAKSRRPTIENDEAEDHIKSQHKFFKVEPSDELLQNSSVSQKNVDTSEKSVKPPKKKKKTNVAEGKLPETTGEGDETNESNSSKRKKQKFQGYTLFIGNLSYDTTKEDVLRHFAKCGAIKNVRIPLEKITNQPRGFGYIEVEEHVTYENVLSMHHTFLKRRRINVECTFGGSKTSLKRMALIKEKTLKLRFLSREGKISSAKQRPWGKFSTHTAID